MNECTHDWLKPEGLKTACKKCGRDAWLSLDVERSYICQLEDLIANLFIRGQVGTKATFVEGILGSKQRKLWSELHLKKYPENY